MLFFLQDVTRCIIAPTNAQVDSYNTAILERLPSESRIYHASNSFKECDETNFVAPQVALDYYMFHPPSGFPPSKLIIKTGAVYRLLRNFIHSRHIIHNIIANILAVRNGMAFLEGFRIFPNSNSTWDGDQLRAVADRVSPLLWSFISGDVW